MSQYDDYIAYRALMQDKHIRRAKFAKRSVPRGDWTHITLSDRVHITERERARRAAFQVRREESDYDYE